MTLTTITGSRDETLKAVLDKAAERIGECDSVLVLMQKKSGGIIWEGPPEMQVQAMIYIAFGFVLGMYDQMREG
jgi:hypothetical protein